MVEQLPNYSLKTSHNLEDLRNTSEDRIVLSHYIGADIETQLVVLKFVMFNETEEIFYLHGSAALGLLEQVKKPFVSRRYKDRRKNDDDPTPNEPMVVAFVDMQPEIYDEELLEVDESRLIKKIETFEFDNAFIFIFTLGDKQEHRYIIMDQVALYMMEYLEQLRPSLKP